jgi:serine/threonine protein kinase/Leucine-rich repeat (LRR) protein
MAELSTCPSRDELQRMVLGQLGDEAAERVQKHPDQCAKCVSALQQCVASDAFLDVVRASRPASCERTKTLDVPVGWVRSAASTSIRSHESTQPDKHIAPLPMSDVKSLLSPAQSADEIGRVAEFRVLRVLGVGGMAVVFEAEDSRLKRRVALKLMLPAIASKPGATQRFLREAQSAAALKHGHVVTIYQVGMHGETPFIALELLHGETLEDYLLFGGRMRVRDVVRVGREIAAGLAAAHARGLLHRDIKPANIWLEGPDAPVPAPSALNANRGTGSATGQSHPAEFTNDRRSAGKVKILDFGLAKVWTDESGISYPGLLIGTPAYMAPEQFAGTAVDPRADLFSLGCVLYRMASGQSPFGRGNVLSIVRALALDDPPPVRAANREIPRALSDLIGALLSKSADERPSSAQAVVERLQAIEEELPPREIAARSAEKGLSTEGHSLRGSKLKWGVGAAVVVAILLPLVYLLFGNQLTRVVTTASLTVAPQKPSQVESPAAMAKEPTKEVTKEVTKDQTSGPTAVSAVDPRAGTVLAALSAPGVQGLVSLDLSGASIGDADWLRLKRLTHLRRLVLEGAILNGHGLEELRGLTNLDELILSGTQTTDVDLAQLRGLSKLTSLTLDRTPLTDVGLQQVAALSGLKSLILRNTAVTDAGLKNLERLAGLKNLVLEGTHISDAGLGSLQRLAELNNLSLGNTAVTDAGLKHLQGLTKLENLWLSGAPVTGAGLISLQALKNLHVLILNWTGVSDEALVQLRGLPQLEELGLRGTHVTDAGLAHLHGLTKLRTLNLSVLPITDAGVEQLRALKNLQQLDLTRTRVTDAGLGHLRELTRVDSLSLGETPVTEAGLTELQSLKNLHVLGLRGLPWVSDTTIPQLLHLQDLREIDLRDTHVSAKGFRVLKALLPNARITWSEPNYAVASALLAAGGSVDVRLEGTGAERSIKTIGALPAESFQITRARLAGSRRALNELLPAITNPRLDGLVSLDLSGAAINDADVELLKPLVTLRELTLADTRVTDAGLVPLKSLISLRRLVLDGDAIHGPGLRHLQELPELTELRLGCPALSDLFLVELAGVKKLERLSLAKSPVSDEGANSLSRLTRLKELDLGDTKVTAARLEELKTSLPRCRLITTAVARQLARP